MGVDPVSLSVIGGVAGSLFGAVSGSQQAKKKNDAAKRSEASAREAAAIQSKQLTAQEAQQHAQRVQESRRLRASILAAGGSSGFSLDSGDIVDATGASDAYASQDLATLAANLQSNLDRVRSGLDANIISIDSSRSSAAGAGLTGGLAGLGEGLSLSSHLDSIFNDPTRQAQILAARNGGGMNSNPYFIGPPTQ